VQLDRRLGLRELGETVSRILTEHESANGKTVLEFDILTELVVTFDLQTVAKFLHLLENRVENVGGLSHYYVNPDQHPASTLNILDQLFDLSVTANEHTIVSKGGETSR
jgi:regulator of RNase E activity RraB